MFITLTLTSWQCLVFDMTDIIIDTNVMRLYDKPKDEEFIALFNWLKEKGTLVVNQNLISEYCGHGNPLLMPLIDFLSRDSRLIKISTQDIKNFELDKHYTYTCNKSDITHARTVFLSKRKKFIGFDKKLGKDINRLKKIDGVKTTATRKPITNFYC